MEVSMKEVCAKKLLDGFPTFDYRVVALHDELLVIMDSSGHSLVTKMRGDDFQTDNQGHVVFRYITGPNV